MNNTYTTHCTSEFVSPPSLYPCAGPVPKYPNHHRDFRMRKEKLYLLDFTTEPSVAKTKNVHFHYNNIN